MGRRLHVLLGRCTTGHCIQHAVRGCDGGRPPPGTNAPPRRHGSRGDVLTRAILQLRVWRERMSMRQPWVMSVTVALAVAGGGSSGASFAQGTATGRAQLREGFANPPSSA